MMAYVRLWRLCAVHVECGKELAARPLFARTRHGRETIIDLPYCRAVFTPGNVRAGMTGEQKEQTGTRKNARRRKGTPCSPAGATEN